MVINNFQTTRLVIVFSLSCVLGSCSPKVMSFYALPCTTITQEDSVRFNWKVRGKPTLLFYQEDAGDDENPGKYYQYYKLVAQKKGRKDDFKTLTLTVLKDTSTDYIVINTIRRGDSAIATATKDTLEWGRRFILDRVASGSGRSITVTHLNQTIELDQAGHMSTGLKGLPNSGPWELRTLLTEAEQKDTTRIPGRLVLKTIIIHQNR